jgi:hypothetical protein
MENLTIFNKKQNREYISYLEKIINSDERLKEFELCLNEIKSYIQDHTDEYNSKELGILAKLIDDKISTFPDSKNIFYNR